MKQQAATRALHRLAALYGVQTAYYDVRRQRKAAPAGPLLSILRRVGASVETEADIPAALRERRQALWRKMTPPVAVAWDGGPWTIELCLPQRLADGNIQTTLKLEEGHERHVTWRGSDVSVVRSEEVEGEVYVVKELRIDAPIPFGYHKMAVEVPGASTEVLIISAPSRAYVPDNGQARFWGVFLPLYALRSEPNGANGTYSALEDLTRWVCDLGGSVVGTLPLLPTFLERPLFDPSPYAPVSRLLWSEFFIDTENIHRSNPTGRCNGPGEPRSSGSIAGRLVDYESEMGSKRQVLEDLSQRCFEEPSRDRDALKEFITEHPIVERYARFRAVCERRGTSWATWPEEQGSTGFTPKDYDRKAVQYYLYAQWLAHKQMKSLSMTAASGGLGLYLDLPLGVNPGGYDTWANPGLFAQGTSVGSPPDTFFTRGQDWGFQPMLPEALRQEHYSHLVAVLRHHMSHAGVLRLDHVMGLHRLFWIEHGRSAADGVYVRYPAEEMYAIISLESHRNRCWVIGENLGTVPTYVNSAMARHGLGRMYVLPFQWRRSSKRPLETMPTNSVASVNTHDMPTFTSFWSGADIDLRRQMGLLSPSAATREERGREARKRTLARHLHRQGLLEDRAGPWAVHAAVSEQFASGPARLLLVNLEDLWQETEQQNFPGTGPESPNWRRKARYSFEEFRRLRSVTGTLGRVDRARKEIRR